MLASGSTMSMPTSDNPLVESPRDRETDLPLTDIRIPTRKLPDLVLSDDLSERLDELVDEIQAWPRLDMAGLPRRQTILLYGPPGCGKTSIAEALASAASRLLVTVKTDAVLSSYLGETASNLSQIFEFARLNPFVVLFDEFDSLGKLRDDPSDHGELRRIVNAVLQLIDRYSGPSIIIAATNHQEVLDSALWRRFSEVLEVGLPSQQMRVNIISRVLLGRVACSVRIPVAAEALDGLPHAASERVAEDALRLAILQGRDFVEADDLKKSVERNLSRRWS